MKKITVLFVDHAPIMGGAERSLLLLIKGLDKSRFNVILACPSDTEFASQASKAGAKIVQVEMGQLRKGKNPFKIAYRFVKGFWQLVAVAKKERVDIIHSNAMRASIYAAAVAKFAGARFVWHVRDIHKESLYKAMLSRMADRIVAISIAVRDSLPENALDKTQVIYNAVDLEGFNLNETDPLAFRKSIGVAEDAFLIGNVGWIAPWKRTELFLEAAVGLAGHLPRVRFVVVGEASDARYVDYVEKIKHHYESSLCGKLIWAGARDNMPEVMASLDVLVHAADDEPFGRVLIEAMAMGRPVVAPDSGGPAEIVSDGLTGFLFKPGDVKSLEGAIAKIFDNHGFAQSLGRAGSERVRKLFTLQNQVKKIERLYDEVIRGTQNKKLALSK